MEFFEAHIIITANDRLRILAGVLQKDAFKAYEGFRPAIVTYQQSVVPGRNQLGHMTLVPQGKRQAVVDSRGVPITLEETVICVA